MSWNNCYRQREKSNEEKFWEKVDIKSDEECWEWKASHNKKGYGNFYVSVGHSKDKHCLAHRMSYMLTYKIEVPSHTQVCHTCDNPGCVNPKHLWLGTNKENALDSVKKGRKRGARGTRNFNAKLTEEQVIEIRKLKKQGYTLADLGRKYNVHFSTIGYLVRGNNWAWLKDEE